MYNYTKHLSEGLYGKQKKKESEKYFLMSIDKGNSKAMFDF
jgi:hypothetical protein